MQLWHHCGLNLAHKMNYKTSFLYITVGPSENIFWGEMVNIFHDHRTLWFWRRIESKDDVEPSLITYRGLKKKKKSKTEVMVETPSVDQSSEFPSLWFWLMVSRRPWTPLEPNLWLRHLHTHSVLQGMHRRRRVLSSSAADDIIEALDLCITYIKEPSELHE